nr:uncharacterized protein LOC109729418 [Microcebus murinus]
MPADPANRRSSPESHQDPAIEPPNRLGAAKSVSNLSKTLRGIWKTQVCMPWATRRKSATREDLQPQHVSASPGDRPVSQGKFGHGDTPGEGSHVAERCPPRPRNTIDCWRPPGAGRDQGGPSVRAGGRSMACRNTTKHPDLGLPASRTVSRHISVILSHLVTAALGDEHKHTCLPPGFSRASQSCTLPFRMATAACFSLGVQAFCRGRHLNAGVWWTFLWGLWGPVTVPAPVHLLWSPLGPGEPPVFSPGHRGLQAALGLTPLHPTSCPESSGGTASAPALTKCHPTPVGCGINSSGNICALGLGLGFLQGRGPAAEEGGSILPSL